MKLQELVDDVLLEARNNHISESEKLSRHQIELWIHSYRAMYIKQALDKGEILDPQYIQTIPMHISKVEEQPGHYEYMSDETLPRLISTGTITGLIAVKDQFGNIIQLGSETKMKLQKYRKYTCKDYIAYTKGDKIYVEGDSNLLEYIDVDILAEDPTDLKKCYNPEEDEYPIAASIWPTIKDTIFNADIRVMQLNPSDVTNDSKDDLQNRYNVDVNRKVRR